MLDIMSYMVEHNHESLLTCVDRQSGLRALIALHNTSLGPGLGGIRMWPYESTEAAMLDALRLSEGMTYKAAIAGLPLGGGKSVILADGKEQDPLVRKARLQAFGRYVEGLGGRYIAAEDVGTTTDDIQTVRETTSHVAGLPLEVGGSGDPSPMTAYGVVEGQRALLEEVLHTERFLDIRVAVQGLGKVGMDLASRLVAAGAYVVATDVRPGACRRASEQLGIQVIRPDEIYDVDCEIFAPCALGGVINDQTLSRLKCRIVAGSANNQLEETRHGLALHEKGIVYAVDYVVNAGGLINVANELGGYVREKALAQVAQIYHTVKRLIFLSRKAGISAQEAAGQMALERLQAGNVVSE